MSWNKPDFRYSGGYLTYQGQFVARFRYAAARKRYKPFKKFLTSHFTPQEYFDLRDQGRAPLEILMDRGFEL